MEAASKARLRNIPNDSDVPPLCRPTNVCLVHGNPRSAFHGVEIQIFAAVQILEVPSAVPPGSDLPDLASKRSRRRHMRRQLVGGVHVELASGSEEQITERVCASSVLHNLPVFSRDVASALHLDLALCVACAIVDYIKGAGRGGGGAGAGARAGGGGGGGGRT